MTARGAERMELRVDRDAEAFEQTRVHACPALVFPLETTVMALRAGKVTERVDRSSFAIVPARTGHHIEPSISGTAIVVTLLVHAATRAAAVRDYRPEVDPRRLEQVVSAVRFLPRTRWVDELVHRYVFERGVCSRRNSKASHFLEAELTKEMFFLGCEQLDHQTRSSVLFEGGTVAARARAWIEDHLFEPFRMKDLLRHCHASESTVLRAFRRELGLSPIAYLRRRRLEEGLQLIESGRYAVTEVAARIGYANPSAFAAAFREQFGVSPKAARTTAPAATWLPAHGAPPMRRPRRRS